jgi:NTE family protein
MHREQMALVLSGGGARGAYQAGVLQGLLESGLFRKGCPFPILVGTSAGAIHATALAAYADRFEMAVAEIVDVWTRIRAKDVFRTDLRSVSTIAFRWARDLGFGGLLGGVAPKALLDTSPLPRLLSQIPFDRIQRQIDHGHLQALAVPATEYFSGESVIFLQGRPGIPGWRKQRSRVEHAKIGLRHIMASSAIPLFFPTVELDGRHFGDGCLRNTTPLGPAIRLGASRILAVGVQEPAGTAQSRPPMVADVAGTVLDAIMMDAMEKDVAHCQRINQSLKGREAGGFRPVEVMWLAPTTPIGPLAQEMMDRIPPLIRYLLHGLGGDRAAAELASYLLFHPDYCRNLLALGRQQAMEQHEELAAFLMGEPVPRQVL